MTSFWQKYLPSTSELKLSQIAALSIMTVVLATLRKTTSFKQFSLIANVALMIGGFVLLAMQIHGYTHGHEEQAPTQIEEQHDKTPEDHTHEH